jgi:hypothetical protein
VLVCEFDTGLRFIDGLPDQVHRSGAMATLVCSRFSQRSERLREGGQCPFDIDLIGFSGFAGRSLRRSLPPQQSRGE